MKVCLQRVASCSVTIDGQEQRSIQKGLLLLLGVCDTDVLADAVLLAKKAAHLRIFEDEAGKLNLSAIELGLDCMVVSNFTLCADSKKGRRPSFIKAAKPPFSIDAYNMFVDEIKNQGFANVQTGEFGADMQIALVNDGPTTIILDTDDWK